MICYVIQAHHQPAHFHRLVRALTAHSAVVAHIDARVDERPFHSDDPRLSFVSDRVRVTWGGFSQVEATLALLRSARSLHPDATHIWFISGDSYPTRDPRALHEMLADNPDRQLINIRPMPAPEMGKPITRLSRLWIPHDPRTNPLALGFKAIQRIVPQPYRRSLEGLRPYAGSNWFALSAAAVDWILARSQELPRFRRLCRHTICSDEHYLQTLFGDSPFLADAVPVGMFADFTTPPGPWPCVLGVDQIDRIVASAESGATSGYGTTTTYFARKFRDDSVDLLREIEERLWPLPLTEPSRARFVQELG